MEKNKILTTIVILATLILAGIAVFTALKLYGRGSETVSPASPASQPAAGGRPRQCQALIFSLTEDNTPTPTKPDDQPTNTPRPSASPTATKKPSPTPTDQIGGPDPSFTPTPTSTTVSSPTPTQGDITNNNPSPTPTQPVGGNSDPTPTDTRIAQANTPTPESGGVGGTDQELPPAGTYTPTLIFGVASILFILLGLALAF